jgi:hypothetical protein
MATQATKKKQSTHVSHEQETWDDISVHDIDIEQNGESNVLPNIRARDGFTQRWIRTKLNGEDDPRRIASAFNQHWRRRDPSTIPAGEMAPSIHVEGVGECIGLSGMVLMERPEAISAQYARRVRQQTKTQMDAVDESLFQSHTANSGFGAPQRVEDKTQVKVGSGIIPDDD